MSFETTVLRRLAGQTGVPLVQLLDDADCRPPDLAAVGDPTTYADLCTPEGLARIDEYADGIGPRLALVLPRDADDNVTVPSTLVRDAHRLWLTVHVWTLRRENRFLPANLRGPGGPETPGDLARVARLLLDAGVDGLITDHPDLLLDVLDERPSGVHPLWTGLSSAAPVPKSRRLVPNGRDSAHRHAVCDQSAHPEASTASLRGRCGASGASDLPQRRQEFTGRPVNSCGDHHKRRSAGSDPVPRGSCGACCPA